MSIEHPHHRHEQTIADHKETQHNLSREAQAHFVSAQHCGRHSETAHKHLPAMTIVDNRGTSGGDKSEFENMTPAQKRGVRQQWKINDAHGAD